MAGEQGGDGAQPYDKHRYKNRYFRPETELYEAAAEILRAQGSNVNDYLEECLRKLVSRHSAEPPERPGS